MTVPVQPYRLGQGYIDRNVPLSFRFNGKYYSGYAGDTLASALLANGVRLVGRSFKYHRPRGIMALGAEEANALLTITRQGYAEPNCRATTTLLYDGLQARSQNHWGSLKYDFLSLNDYFSAFLSAGFYYKTFMWPAALWEKLYEPLIRRAAGLGKLPITSPPAVFDKGYQHCDVLVIGGGVSGLMAALHAGRSGARVILAEQDRFFGGRLLYDDHSINDAPARDWLATVVAELQSMDNVQLWSGAVVYGAYDHGIYGVYQQCLPITNQANADQLNDEPQGILWRVYSSRAIVCAGAWERPIAFADNDRPGIMLAGAVRGYAEQYGVACGMRVGVYANNDDALHRTVAAVQKIGQQAIALDARKVSVVSTSGRHGLSQVNLSDGQTLKLDCLAVSGGWNPVVHLTAQMGHRPVWQDDIAAFVPAATLPAGQHVAGAAAGYFSLSACLHSGAAAAEAACVALGFAERTIDVPAADTTDMGDFTPIWQVSAQWLKKKRAWVDLQNDVTTKDIRIACAEGFQAVEHLKRYTTLGMATDQGKTSNVVGLAVMAELCQKPIAEVGTTMFRPPVSAIPIGAFAGRAVAGHYRPVRYTPSHGWAQQQGATFTEAGLWMRAQWYTQAGETYWRHSVDREVAQVRRSVGFCDVSTLGKIEIQGADSTALLNKVYANPFASLAVGRVRYGLMLREDGLVMDDGTSARLAEDHYVMTTTTANAVAVYRHLEFMRQCLCPDWDVVITSVTEQWAQYSVAGPKSRKVLEAIVDPQHDISPEVFPFMACAQISVCGGVPARLFRISFSGERAYEIAVPARYGHSLAEILMRAGEPYDITPYGTEALGVLRIEKGHVAGNELNGQTAALHMGLGSMVSQKKEAIGTLLSQRKALVDPQGLRLVGLRNTQSAKPIIAGAHLLNPDDPARAGFDQGYVTSAAYSPIFKGYIALAYLKDGDSRHGQKIRAWSGVHDSEVVVDIVSPHFYDPNGGRQRD